MHFLSEPFASFPGGRARRSSCLKERGWALLCMVPAATEPGDEGLRRFRVSGQGVVTVGTADAGIFKRWRLYVCQDILKTYLTQLNVSWQRLRTGGNSTRRKDRSSDASLCGPNCQDMSCCTPHIALPRQPRQPRLSVI